MPKHMLHFKGRKALLADRHQEHRHNPVAVRKFRSFQNGATSQGCSELTVLTLILPNALLPVVFPASAQSFSFILTGEINLPEHSMFIHTVEFHRMKIPGDLT